MRTGLFHSDSVPIEDGGRLAQFVAGTTETITPAAAFAAWTAGESASAAAARQRMIERHGHRTHSTTTAEGQERMIQRGGNGNGEA